MSEVSRDGLRIYSRYEENGISGQADVRHHYLYDTRRKAHHGGRYL